MMANWKVSCPCGGHIRIDRASIGKLRPCPSCGVSCRVIMKPDGRTPTVEFEKAAKSFIRPPKPGAGKRTIPLPSTHKPPAGKQDIVCPCGHHLMVSPLDAGKEAQCPACRRTLVLKGVRDPQTLMTRIIPRTIGKPPPAPKPQRQSTRRRKPPPKPQPEADVTLKTTTRRRRPALVLDCTCGKRLLVRKEDDGKRAKCPACGRVAVIVMKRDPQTLGTVVRAIDLNE